MEELKEKYFFGVGRRKSSVARVRIYRGAKKLFINNKEIKDCDDYCTPFSMVGESDSFYIKAIVAGGGKQGQKEAIVHGISRALVTFNSEYRSALKKAGYLKRDPREKERKKPGRKKARKSPQWSKR